MLQFVSLQRHNSLYPWEPPIFWQRIIKASLERPTFIFTITHPGWSKNIHTIVYINFSWLISLPIFKSIDLTIKRIPTTAANFPLARSKYTDLSRGWVQVTVEWIGNRVILYVVVFFIFCCFDRDSKFTAKMRCYSQCNVAAPPSKRDLSAMHRYRSSPGRSWQRQDSSRLDTAS